jgi:hypothetical protein
MRYLLGLLGNVLLAQTMLTSPATVQPKNDGTPAQLRLRAGSNYVEVKPPALAASYGLTLPADDGDANECLVTDGSGVLSFSSCASPANMVTTDTVQTISAKKTFSGGMAITDEVEIDNGIALQWKDSEGTLQNVIRMNGDNVQITSPTGHIELIPFWFGGAIKFGTPGTLIQLLPPDDNPPDIGYAYLGNFERPFDGVQTRYFDLYPVRDATNYGGDMYFRGAASYRDIRAFNYNGDLYINSPEGGGNVIVQSGTGVAAVTALDGYINSAEGYRVADVSVIDANSIAHLLGADVRTAANDGFIQGNSLEVYYGATSLSAYWDSVAANLVDMHNSTDVVKVRYDFRGIGGLDWVQFNAHLAPWTTNALDIGTNSLRFKVYYGKTLDVDTSFRLGSSTTAGYVLTADAGGYGTWQAAPTGGVASVTGTAPITASPTTGAVEVSCSTCVTTDTSQTISGQKTFTSATSNIFSTNVEFNGSIYAADGTLSVDSSLIPNGDDLGSVGSRWNSVYAGALNSSHTFRLGNTQTAGHVLTSDASGYGTWQALTACANCVTTDTNQTISGTKTFTSASANVFSSIVAFDNVIQASDGSISVNSALIPVAGDNLGSATFRWGTAYVGTLNSSVGVYIQPGALFRLNDSSTSGYVLTANANGYGTWQAPPAGAVASVNGTSPISVSPTTGTVYVSCSTCATTDTSQTFTGEKTFASSGNATYFRGIFPTQAGVWAIGSSTDRFAGAYFNGVYAYNGY